MGGAPAIGIAKGCHVYGAAYPKLVQAHSLHLVLIELKIYLKIYKCTSTNMTN